MPLPRTRIVVAVAIAAIVVLALAVLLLGPRLVGEARLRSELETRLTALAGREVRVRGPVRVTTGATVEVDVSDVTVARESGGRVEAAAGALTQPLPPLMRIGRVRASVGAASLLGRSVRVWRVHIEDAHVYLQVDANGRGNWEGLGAATGGAPADAPGAPPLAWTIDGLTLERSSLHWSDARTGAAYALDDWQAELGRVALPEPFDVQTRFRVLSRDATLGRANVVARVTADTNAQRYAMEALTVDGAIEGAVTSSAQAAPPPKANAPTTSTSPAPLPARLTLARLDYDGRAGTAAVRELAAALAGVELRADGKATDISTTPRIDARLATNAFEPRTTLQSFGVSLPPMQGPNALARAQVRATLTGTPDALSLADLDATLDDTRLTGRATRASPAGWTFDLAADRLVVDRYLKPAKLRDASPVLLPTDLLKSLAVQGTLRVGALVASGVTLKNVVVDLGGAPAAAKSR